MWLVGGEQLMVAEMVTDGVSFLLFCRSLTETMSTVDWSEGRWKPYGKDLETALQSKEAQACTE